MRKKTGSPPNGEKGELVMYHHILIPVAGVKPGSSDAALSIARNLLASGGKITLIHVIEPVPGYALGEIPADIFRKSRDTIAEGMRALAETAGSDVHEQIAHGHPGREIVGTVDTAGVDCIIIKSHMPGLEDYLFGSTAAWVVRHAKCAVHVIR
jgi:universal stress protein F